MSHHLFLYTHTYILTLSLPRGTDGSFQPALSMTIVLFMATTLPCQVGLLSSIESWGQK